LTANREAARRTATGDSDATGRVRW
jgi:hypothetical protein